MKPQPAGNEFAAFIGIDWADAKHDIWPRRSREPCHERADCLP